ncbi:hypothetical protein [Nocardioides sp. zg-DK7169]|uniref:hypothetical protein n=1 Tax=Nocardioides sp. zg-DK7169 TaxID=2736600 RepID=UPI001554AF84|nr:hypothetical protein [Nocardioides sp. zg-DK7169]NPC95680.1 hypothetical protein [Nocardioides sp. zg-DK7169]
MPRAERRARARRVLAAGAAALALACFGVAAVGPGAVAADATVPGEEPTATATPSPEATPSADPTAEPTPEATPDPTPSGEPTATPSEDPDDSGDPDEGVLEVSEAVFRWGVSNQSNARSHNPVSINFLAAGVANPGGGGRQLRQDQWRAVQGNAEIQKRRPDGRYARATWAGLGTTPDGRRIGMERDFSDHHVVIRGGTGTVDPASGDAEVAWTGTFTVVYYGGNTVFTVSNPRLVVKDGVGRVTATMGGFYADRNDTTLWKKAPQRQATIADLPDVDLGALGATVQPAYDRVETSGGSEPQRREGADWGSFPQSLVSYLVPLNTDQFWYSTGLSTDGTKRPLPITFSWTAREVAPPAPEPTTAPPATPSNPVVTPPPATSVPVPGGSVPVAGAPVSGSLSAGGLPGTGVPAGPVGTVPGAAGTGSLPASTQLVATAPVTAPAAVAGSTWWWVGGSLLLLSALLLLLPGGVLLPVSRRP